MNKEITRQEMIVLPKTRRDYLRYKEAARALVHFCLRLFTARYTFAYKKIFIKNLRRNWGSCSELGNLNFNYKIVLLPRRLAEYVVFHELCHLEEFNHSPEFWSLVSREFPEHKTLRTQLRKYHI